MTQVRIGPEQDGRSSPAACLAFVREAQELSSDRAGSKGELSGWLHRAGLMERPSPVGTHQPKEGLALAKAIEACVCARIEATELPAADVARINRSAAAPCFPQLQPSARVVWQAPRPVEGAFARIARGAVDLVGGELASRIRRCPGRGCGVLFVDRSSSGTARWCSMARCGNKAKVNRYRRRSSEVGSKEPIYGR